MIVFNYKEEPLGGLGKIYRPVADVSLKTKLNSWVEFHPYIDSGADFTMIPLSLGKLLGYEVDQKKIQQIGGISGSVPVIFESGYIKIGDEEFIVNFVWSLVEDVPPLLGRAGVFDYFQVKFKQFDKQIIFERRL